MSRAANPPPQDALRALLEAQYREALAPVTACMLASAQVAAGQRVLDVGSGSGDMALLAAALAGPTGFVLATDISLESMAPLVERIRTLPQPHRIGIREAAAEHLELDPATFDVALARNSVMFFEDRAQALRNVRAALRSGGRLVASVYGPLEREPFHAIPIAAVQRRCEIREPFPDYVQAFRSGSQDVEHALRIAGFQDVALHAVPIGRAYPSVAAAIELLRHSRSLGQLLSLLLPDQREDAWTEIADGFRPFESQSGLHLPGEQVVIVGMA